MKRRDFLQLAALAPLYTMAPQALAKVEPSSDTWRTFELTYEVDLTAQLGAGQLWLPLPQHAEDYQKVLSVKWEGGAVTSLDWDKTYQAPIFASTWAGGDSNRTLSVTAQVATRNRPIAAPARHLHDMDEVALYLEPTEHMPVDGIVLDRASMIVKGIQSPDAKAKAIYEWIVDNTFREPTVRGCGMGNIKFMLESGDLGGKCADINSLFVGLARAVGIPARECYGVRVADSALFKSLGKSGDVSKAQHCRAEFFSARHGWVPVDPADVRKVVLEEKLALNDPKVIALRKRLFGYWEMNWVSFNHGRDFILPGNKKVALSYLMYPYAEFGNSSLDGREPGEFKFRLNSRQLG